MYGGKNLSLLTCMLSSFVQARSPFPVIHVYDEEFQRTLPALTNWFTWFSFRHFV